MPDLTVHDAVNVIPVAPEKGKVEHLKLRGNAAPDGGPRHHEVDEAFLDLLHDLALLTERAAREDANRDRVVGRLLGERAKAFGEHMQRRRARGHRMRESKHDWPGPAAGTTAGRAERGGAQRREETTPADTTEHVSAHYACVPRGRVERSKLDVDFSGLVVDSASVPTHYFCDTPQRMPGPC